MINEFVDCDMCGQRIEKEKKHMWHNINVVRHLRPHQSSDVNRDMNASFHVCTDDLENILFEVLGVNLDDKHASVLLKKIEEKLRLTP